MKTMPITPRTADAGIYGQRVSLTQRPGEVQKMTVILGSEGRSKTTQPAQRQARGGDEVWAYSTRQRTASKIKIKILIVLHP